MEELIYVKDIVPSVTAGTINATGMQELAQQLGFTSVSFRKLDNYHGSSFTGTIEEWEGHYYLSFSGWAIRFDSNVPYYIKWKESGSSQNFLVTKPDTFLWQSATGSHYSAYDEQLLEDDLYLGEVSLAIPSGYCYQYQNKRLTQASNFKHIDSFDKDKKARERKNTSYLRNVFKNKIYQIKLPNYAIENKTIEGATWDTSIYMQPDYSANHGYYTTEVDNINHRYNWNLITGGYPAQVGFNGWKTLRCSSSIVQSKTYLTLYNDDYSEESGFPIDNVRSVWILVNTFNLARSNLDGYLDNNGLNGKVKPHLMVDHIYDSTYKVYELNLNKIIQILESQNTITLISDNTVNLSYLTDITNKYTFSSLVNKKENWIPATKSYTQTFSTYGDWSETLINTLTIDFNEHFNFSYFNPYSPMHKGSLASESQFDLIYNSATHVSNLKIPLPSPYIFGARTVLNADFLFEASQNTVHTKNVSNLDYIRDILAFMSQSRYAYSSSSWTTPTDGTAIMQYTKHNFSFPLTLTSNWDFATQVRSDIFNKTYSLALPYYYHLDADSSDNYGFKADSYGNFWPSVNQRMLITRQVNQDISSIVITNRPGWSMNVFPQIWNINNGSTLPTAQFNCNYDVLFLSTEVPTIIAPAYCDTFKLGFVFPYTMWKNLNGFKVNLMWNKSYNEQVTIGTINANATATFLVNNTLNWVDGEMYEVYFVKADDTSIKSTFIKIKYELFDIPVPPVS